MKIKRKRFDKKLLFYIGLLSLPLLQFCIFYIYVNFNSFYLSIREYDAVTRTFSFAGFDNFKEVFNTLFVEDRSIYWIRLKNSFFNYCMTLAVGMGGAVFFSYYIYKKQFFSGFFKILLFVPHIIPSIALLSIFKTFIDKGGVTFVQNVLHLNIKTLLGNEAYNYPIILTFALLIGFGTQVMLYLGAMNKINPSITEAAELDGITFFKELWYITLPNVFPTISTFLVVGVTNFCIADMGVFGMFGSTQSVTQNIQTIGFDLHKRIVAASNEPARWGYLSAYGLCITLIIAPITYFLKRFLDKADPVS